VPKRQEESEWTTLAERPGTLTPLLIGSKLALVRVVKLPLAWSPLILCFSVVTGCGKGECTKFGGCPQVDEDAGAGARLVTLDQDALLFFESGFTPVVLSGGEVIFTPTEPGCVASMDHPCQLVLQRLQFRVGNFDIPYSDGSRLAVDEPVVSLTAPVELVDNGSGYFVPASSVFQTCASVDGRRQSDSAASQDILVLHVDDMSQSLSVSGAFVLAVHADDDDCSQLYYPMRVTATGRLSP
jgi:hypothetical protein